MMARARYARARARMQLERDPTAFASVQVQPCTLRYARAGYALRRPRGLCVRTRAALRAPARYATHAHAVVAISVINIFSKYNKSNSGDKANKQINKQTNKQTKQNKTEQTNKQTNKTAYETNKIKQTKSIKPALVVLLFVWYKLIN